MPAFQYRPRPTENWDKRSRGSIYDGYVQDEFEMFSPGKENYLRILPPTWENPQHYGLDVWVHFGVGPNNGTVICLYKMKNQKCPICEAHARAEAAGREDAKELKPSRRVLVWMLNRKEEKKPLVWGMPWTVDRDISKICRDRQTGELYMIDHPDQGYDITFDKEGEGIQTKYTGFQLSRRPSSVDKKWIDYVVAHPLPDVLLWRTYDEVLALFEGAPPEESKPTSGGDVVAQDEAPVETAHAHAPTQTAPPPVQMAPPPPKPFVSDWTGENCQTCGRPTYTLSPTTATCEGGHVVNFPVPSVPSVATPPPPKTAAPAVVPAQTAEIQPRHEGNSGNVTATAPAPSTSRAAAMRERFQTGKRA